MNKTISINLSGAIFNIEEDAYNHLKSYLDRIKQMFKGDPGEAEIMADIESRVAELFSIRLNEKKSAILKSDVDEVIQIMGQPEDYISEEKSEKQKEETDKDNTSHERIRNSHRRVYRDSDDAMIGGVCSGLSHYFGWDPVILRILFVVFFFAGGSALLIYIIFWIVLPAADTTAEKLQMRGEPVTVENIRKFVNEEAQEAADNIRNFANKHRSGEFVQKAGGLLKKLFGVAFIILGTFLLIGMVVGLVAADINIFGSGPVSYEMVNQLMFQDDSTLTMLILGGIIVLTIPAIALIYAGIRWTFDIQKRVPGLGISLLVLFLLGLGVCAIAGVKVGRQFAYDADVTNEYHPDPIDADTLIVEVNDDLVFPNNIREHQKELWQMIKVDGDTIVYGAPVHLEFYDDYYGEEGENITITVVKESNGPDRQEAYRLADDIRYHYSLEGNVLKLDPVFRTLKSDLYRNQEVTIRVSVPEGKSITFGKNIGRLNWHHADEGRTMQMGDDGFINISNTGTDQED